MPTKTELGDRITQLEGEIEELKRRLRLVELPPSIPTSPQPYTYPKPWEQPRPYWNPDPTKVTYTNDRTSSCPCRPENGGSGVCNCILGGSQVTC